MSPPDGTALLFLPSLIREEADFFDFTSVFFSVAYKSRRSSEA